VAPSLKELLSLDEAAFESTYYKSPVKRIKRRGLVRNACVAAGNWGDQEAVKLLIPLLSDSEPLIRGHAAWALGCIGGGESFSAIELALTNESDLKIREEMAHALC
jgi:epoxyqueuosine reductase